MCARLISYAGYLPTVVGTYLDVRANQGQSLWVWSGTDSLTLPLPPITHTHHLQDYGSGLTLYSLTFYHSTHSVEKCRDGNSSKCYGVNHALFRSFLAISSLHVFAYCQKCNYMYMCKKWSPIQANLPYLTSHDTVEVVTHLAGFVFGQNGLSTPREA